MGRASVADNSVTLFASDLPLNATTYFLTSLTQDFVLNPGGSQGNLCVGGAIGRYVGPGQVLNSSAAGEASLVLPRRDGQRQAGVPLNLRHELRPIRRLSDRGGGDGGDGVDLHALHQPGEAAQGGQRAAAARRRQAPGLSDLGTQTGQHLLVEEIGGGAAERLEHHQADRVRPHVDHRDAARGGVGLLGGVRRGVGRGPSAAASRSAERIASR